MKFAATMLTLTLATTATYAAETGVLEDWTADDANGWFTQSPHFNPGTGGVGGGDDGFVHVLRESDLPGPLGIHARDLDLNAPFLGDYAAANVASVTFWVKNLGNVDLQIHVGIFDSQFGQGGRYLSNDAIDLPIGTDWTQYTIDFNADEFTYIGNQDPPPSTFNDVFQDVIALLFRHDVKPLESTPPIMSEGAFGLDRVILNPPKGCTGPSGDFDNDGDIDLDDFAAFHTCATGPNPEVPPTDDCLYPFDFDADQNIDLADFAPIQTLFTFP